jgi:tetratricopeptide (TPR) repeat protein
LYSIATQTAGDNSVKRKKKKVWKKNSIKSMFHSAKKMERQGRWGDACTMYEKILRKDPHDAHSHLALARLEARREPKVKIKSTDDVVENNASGGRKDRPILSKAQEVFVNGTSACPDSVHLWQAWAVYEESRGNTRRARELFGEALELDPYNPYVCHAFGLMERKMKNESNAIDLFKVALTKDATAALVCSLGEVYLVNNNTEAARELYIQNIPRLKKEKDKVEVYLAHAWLEERYFYDYERAQELLHLALAISPGSSLANVALARLEGRINRLSNRGDSSGNKATAERLAKACDLIEKGKQVPSDPTDGRVFNALASLEVKARRFERASEILKRGIESYPQDHAVSCQFCFFKLVSI